MDQVIYIKGFLDEDTCDKYMTQLQYGLEWNRPTGYFHRATYRYDIGQNIPVLNELFELIKTQLACNIESAFCNLYEDGSHYTPYHKDSYGCDIATLTFGEKRDFYFKHDKSGEKVHYVLGDGDLIIFPESINKEWKHSIPLRKNCTRPRISIVFFLDK